MKIKSIATALLLFISSVEVFATIETPPFRIVSETIDKDSIQTFIIHYVSVSADGTSKDTVSGLISIPLKGEILAAVLENHHTVASNQEIPSVQGETASAALLRPIACIIAPDYYGYGVTVDKPHNYLCHEQNAANAIDLALIARHIFDSLEVNFDYDALFNFGYSQGGAVALAVHREMEKNQDLADYLKFEKSYCGDGPYDVPATLKYVFELESVPMPVILPLVIKGFLTGYPQYFAEGRKFSDFFNDNLIEAGLESWIDSKNYTTDEISEMMRNVTNGKSTLDAFVNTDLLDTKSVLRKEIESVAQATTVLTDWEATLPIKFFHAKNDEVVPFLNAENAIKSLWLNNDEDNLYVGSTYYTHVSFATSYYAFSAVDMYSIIKGKKDNGEFFLPGPPSAVEEITNNEFDINAPFYDILGKLVKDKNYHGIIFQNGKSFFKE